MNIVFLNIGFVNMGLVNIGLVSIEFACIGFEKHDLLLSHYGWLPLPLELQFVSLAVLVCWNAIQMSSKNLETSV